MHDPNVSNNEWHGWWRVRREKIRANKMDSSKIAFKLLPWFALHGCCCRCCHCSSYDLTMIKHKPELQILYIEKWSSHSLGVVSNLPFSDGNTNSSLDAKMSPFFFPFYWFSVDASLGLYSRRFAFLSVLEINCSGQRCQPSYCRSHPMQAQNKCRFFFFFSGCQYFNSQHSKCQQWPSCADFTIKRYRINNVFAMLRERENCKIVRAKVRERTNDGRKKNGKNNQVNK